jgi:hypothetical protein
MISDKKHMSNNNSANANVQQLQQHNEEQEEFLAIPPTNVLDELGIKRLSQVQEKYEAHRAANFAEIRFKDGDTKIVRIDPTKTEFKEDVIKLENEPTKFIWQYHYQASEYLQGKWTKWKEMKLAPKWGNQVNANNVAGNLTLKITRKGSGLKTNYEIIAVGNVK